MNKERRKRIEHALTALNKAQEILEEVKSDEQDALNNIPDNLQATERSSTMEDGIQSLEEAIGDMEKEMHGVIHNIN
jgi:hypothetical protein